MEIIEESVAIFKVSATYKPEMSIESLSLLFLSIESLSLSRGDKVILPLLPTSSTPRSFLLVDSIGEDSGAEVGLSPEESDSEENNLSVGGNGARKGTLTE